MSTPLLFALNASRELGIHIAEHSDIELGTHEERIFEDGEYKVRPLQCVRGRHVFVLSSLYSDPDLSVNDKLCQLLMFIGALRDASAREVTLVAPYLAYARKDRRTKPRDPLSLRYLAEMLEALGTDRVVTLEVHNPAAFQNAFRCVTEHLSFSALLLQHLPFMLGQEQTIVIVSPDTGGYKRAQELRQRLEKVQTHPVGIAFVEKLRSAGELFHGRLVGDVAGATALIIDDMIVTGRTLIHAAETLKDQGATRVIAIAAHGVFHSVAKDILNTPALDRIVISNSVVPWRLDSSAVRSKIEMVDIAPFLAETLVKVFHNHSLTDWLE